MSKPVLTHANEQGWHRWQLQLSTGAYALTRMAGGTVHLIPLLDQPDLLANPARSTSLMRAWAPLKDDFREEFEAHLLRKGLDPLEAELALSDLRGSIREALDSIG